MTSIELSEYECGLMIRHITDKIDDLDTKAKLAVIRSADPGGYRSRMAELRVIRKKIKNVTHEET